MAGFFDQPPRPLQPGDVHGTRQLLIGALGGTPYLDRALEVLELAAGGQSDEYRAQISARDGTVAALVLHGAIAGSAGGVRIHALAFAPAVVDSDVPGRLVEAVVDDARRHGARFLLAELADDPALGVPIAILRDAGFHEESRIPDFFRDDVALTFLRRAV